MNITRLTTSAQLHSLAEDWNALPLAAPFGRHEWLAAWWNVYGGKHELYVLCLRDASGQLQGLAPLYLERTHREGRVLRLLGSGEVCSDYLGLICLPELRQQTASLLADWLCRRAACSEDGWDALDLEGIDARDVAVQELVQQLETRGCVVHGREGPNCWRLGLPATWAEYEALLSKSHRKQVRRLMDRVFDPGRAVLQTVCDPSQLAEGQKILIDLHQRRRAQLGQPGCFASPRFVEFQLDAMQRLFAAGLLRLHWLELDGRPAAAEYHLALGGVIYGYQAGVAPELLAEEPGRLAAIATLRLAMEQGFTAFDFLRGDEPYKAHFRAQPRRTLRYRLAPPHAAARWRHRAWTVQRNMKDWLRDGRSTNSKPAAACPEISHS